MSELTELKELLKDRVIIPKKEGTPVGDTGLLSVDTDTVRNEGGENVRIQGIDAPEVGHYSSDLQYIPGETTGDLSKEISDNIMKEEGFNNIVTRKIDNFGPDFITGESEARGYFGRPLGDVLNESDQSYAKRLLASGLSTPDRFAVSGNDFSDELTIYNQGGLERAQRLAEGKQTKDDVLLDLIHTYRKQAASENWGTEFKTKPTASSERFYDKRYHSGVSIRNLDRKLNNTVKGWQLDDAWAVGKKSGFVGLSTAAGMIGELVNIDSLENAGYAHALKLKNEIKDLPALRNTVAFDQETGEWTLDGIVKFTDYVSVNIAQSLPVMLPNMLSYALAVPTFGASLLLPYAYYTGSNYDEQETKDMGRAASFAIIQSALDLIGFKGMTSKKLNSLIGSGKAKEVVEELAQQMGISSKKAEDLLGKAIKNKLDEAVTLTESQLKRAVRTSKEKALAVGLYAGAGSVAEGVTESLQESMAILAENNKISPEEIKNRIANAFVAGASIGGVFSAGSGVAENYQQRNAVAGFSEGNSADASMIKAWDEDSTKPNSTKPNSNKGKILSTKEARERNTNTPFNSKPDKKDPNINLENIFDLANTYDKAKDGTKFDRIKDTAGSKSWRGQTDYIFRNFKNNGAIMSRLASIYTGKGRRGGDLEEQKQLNTAKIDGKSVFDDKTMVSNSPFRNIKDFTSYIRDASTVKKYKSVFNLLDSQIKAGNKLSLVQALKNTKLDIKPWEINFIEEVYKSNTEASNQAGKEINVLDRGFSSSKIYKNQTKFEDLLMSETKLSKEEAEKVSQMFSNTEIYANPEDVSDPLINLGAPLQFDPTAFKDIVNNPKFKNFIEDNLFTNISSNANSAAAKGINREYIGANGKLAAIDLNKAVSYGEIDSSERAWIAKELKKYHNQLAGVDNVIRNKPYNVSMNAFSTLSTITGLTLATVSSLPESMTVLFHNNPNKAKAFWKMATLTAKEFTALMNEMATSGSRGIIPMKEYAHRENLRRLGYLADQQNPASRVGAEYSPSQQIFINNFFKYTGLNSLTNIQRGVREAIAEDAVNSWASQGALHIPESGAKPNKYYMESYNRLLDLGVDPELLIMYKYYTNISESADSKFIAKRMEADYASQKDIARLKFVDMAVMQPRKNNRPAFYSDPRYRMFTMFQGYTSTATANLLPEIYKNLGGKNGMPSSSVNAMQTIAGMVALGFLSVAIKDAIRKNEEDDDEPMTFKDAMRALYGSGLVGTAQRPIDAVFPLYGRQQTVIGEGLGGLLGSPARTITNSIIKEATPIGTLDSILDAGKGYITDDKNKERQLLNVLPIYNVLKNHLAPYEK